MYNSHYEKSFFEIPIKSHVKNIGNIFCLCHLVLLVVILTPTWTLASQIYLPRDAEGWTIFTPSTDSRIIYISTNGNDTTGTVYSRTSPEVGIDPFKPTEAIKTFATYSAAYANIRTGYPDWILFKRGEEFVIDGTVNSRDGRSASEPSLISSYGSEGSNPVLKTGAFGGIRIINYFSWRAYSGLTFYAHTRDPNSPDFISSAGANGLTVYIGPGNRGDGLFIEGCVFKFYVNNGGGSDGIALSETIRRTVFLDSYADEGQGHSQGWGGSHYDLIFEENILDHNGWYQQRDSSTYLDSTSADGQATIFNHNIYETSVHDSVYSGNIFARGSSIGTKFTGKDGTDSNVNVTIANNLYVDNEVGIAIGFNYTEDLRFRDITITENVILNMGLSRQTDRTLGWGMIIDSLNGATISSNYILNQTSSDVTLGQAFSLEGDQKDVSIINNVFYGLRYTEGIGIDTDTRKTNIVFSGNKIQIAQNAQYTIDSNIDTTGKITFAGNTYYSDKVDGKQFRITGVEKTFAEWKTATGDTSTFEVYAFPDPTRNIERYMASIGETATLDAFYEKCRKQDRYNWDMRLTASAVNSWIKIGFGVPPTPANFIRKAN